MATVHSRGGLGPGLLVGLLLVGSLACSSSEETSGMQQGTRISIDSGVVQGLVVEGTRAFYNIPYAAPPLGELRFKPPEPVAPWSEDRDATQPPVSCSQLQLVSGAFQGVEDCLIVNVTTPEPAPAAPLPVMVWLHGGGFEGGSGHGDGGYAGDLLVPAGKVVLITVNYRLGALGFLSHAALSAEAADGTSGAYGLLDQRAALEWVQRNAAAFGGDPENVTLFGESAGGMSVCAHLVSPASHDLFHRAVIQSGPCEHAFDTKAVAETQGDKLAAAVGCADDVASCLRDKPAKTLFEALPRVEGLLFGDGVRWRPPIDGAMVTDIPQNLILAGDFARMPTIVGSNKDEGTLFVWLGGKLDITEGEYRELLNFGPMTPEQIEKIEERYPASDFDTPAQALATVVGDGLFTCPTRRMAQALAAGGADVYRYQFVYERDFPLTDLGAYHASELVFLFGHDAFGFGEDLSADEGTLGDALRGYWSSFAHGGAPQLEGGPPWPNHDVSSDQHLVLDLTVSQDSALLSETCDWWDDL